MGYGSAHIARKASLLACVHPSGFSVPIMNSNRKKVSCKNQLVAARMSWTKVSACQAERKHQAESLCRHKTQQHFFKIPMAVATYDFSIGVTSNQFGCERMTMWHSLTTEKESHYFYDVILPTQSTSSQTKTLLKIDQVLSESVFPDFFLDVGTRKIPAVKTALSLSRLYFDSQSEKIFFPCKKLKSYCRLVPRQVRQSELWELGSYWKQCFCLEGW